MFRSFKKFSGYSTTFRQWRAESHCRFLHGYALEFKIWFQGDLDHRNWVCDFGSFKRNGIKKLLEQTFDHTTVIAADDPHLQEFKELEEKGVIQLRVIPHVGCEKFAEWVFHAVDAIVQEESAGRVSIYKVQCWENDKNMAEYLGS